MMRIFPHGTIPGRKKEHERGKRLFGFAFLLLLILLRKCIFKDLLWNVCSKKRNKNSFKNVENKDLL